MLKLFIIFIITRSMKTTKSFNKWLRLVCVKQKLLYRNNSLHICIPTSLVLLCSNKIQTTSTCCFGELFSMQAQNTQDSCCHC